MGVVEGSGDLAQAGELGASGSNAIGFGTASCWKLRRGPCPTGSEGERA